MPLLSLKQSVCPSAWHSRPCQVCLCPSLQLPLWPLLSTPPTLPSFAHPGPWQTIPGAEPGTVSIHQCHRKPSVPHPPLSAAPTALHSASSCNSSKESDKIPQRNRNGILHQARWRKNRVSRPCRLGEFIALSFTLAQSFLAPRAKRMTQAFT